VPFKGAPEALTEIMAGRVDMYFCPLTPAMPLIQAGKLVPLAVSRAQRNVALPDIPTIAEAGVPGYEAVIWLGVVAPKGTPPAIVNRLNAEIAKVVNNPDVRAEWAKQGATAMTMPPEEFSRYVADDIAKWEKVIKVSGAKPDK
jgi:tripartite-type tricarboxylate transporter receptor subunit TctC